MYVREIIAAAPTAERLLELAPSELDRLLLSFMAAVTDDQLRRMTTRESIMVELFNPLGGYDGRKREAVQRAIADSWHRLEAISFIEEPDSDNGKNGYRVVSPKGRKAETTIDIEVIKVRGWLLPERLHPAVREAAWRAFNASDYDTAVFEAFKAVEIAVRKKGGYADTDYGQSLMKKAFDPLNGPLTDKTAKQGRREARQNLFAGALGELRNPKAHSDPTITDPLVAIEEMMAASMLLRIVG